LRPGSVSLVLKPVQYIDTPSGFGDAKHLYKLQLQLVAELSADDILEGVDVEMTVKSAKAEITIDEIFPKPGFSVIGVKSTVGLISGNKGINTVGTSVVGEVGGKGAKATGSMGKTHTEEVSRLINVAKEEEKEGVEQYLIARNIGNGAMWRVLAGKGPVDAGGLEYSAHLLVPVDVLELALKAQGRAYWRRGGEVPASLRFPALLPHDPSFAANFQPQIPGPLRSRSPILKQTRHLICLSGIGSESGLQPRTAGLRLNTFSRAMSSISRRSSQKRKWQGSLRIL